MLGNLNSVLAPTYSAYRAALTHIRVNGDERHNQLLDYLMGARENGEPLSHHYDDVVKLAQYV